MHRSHKKFGFLVGIAIPVASAFVAAFPKLCSSRLSGSFASAIQIQGGQKLAMSTSMENGEEGASAKPSKVITGWDDNNDAGEVADDPLFDEYCSVMDDFGCEAYEDLAKNDLDEKVYRWIRVEAREDETLAGIKSKEDVMSKIDEVRSFQSKYGPSQLYYRKWENKPNNDCFLRANGDRAPSFSVLQFNVLAEGLSAGSNVKTPFPADSEKDESEHKKKNDPGYGGFTQVKSPEVCLDFNLRRWRLLEVILGMTSIQQEEEYSQVEGVFDIMALEEIDRFRGLFAPVLRLFGYEGIFMPKTKAPGVSLGYYSDGCALFWKANTFELVSEKRIKFKVGNQIMIIAQLKHKSSGINMLVAVTHLKAQKNETNEKIRCKQVEELLDHVQQKVIELGNKDMPVLIMGDFNADPPAQLPFPDSSVRKVLRNHLDADDDKQQPIRFQSAYSVDPPEETMYTTWKTRGTNTVRRIIDYIFHSERLRCTATLSVPSSEELEESKLPGLRFPSDHLMIAAKYELAHDKGTD